MSLRPHCNCTKAQDEAAAPRGLSPARQVLGAIILVGVCLLSRQDGAIASANGARADQPVHRADIIDDIMDIIDDILGGGDGEGEGEGGG